MYLIYFILNRREEKQKGEPCGAGNNIAAISKNCKQKNKVKAQINVYRGEIMKAVVLNLRLLTVERWEWKNKGLINEVIVLKDPKENL